MGRKNSRLLKRDTCWRYILSFLVILVLPIAFFSVFFLKNNRDIYEEMILEQARASLDSTMMELERNIEALEAIVNYNMQHYYMQEYAIRKEYANTEIRVALSSAVITHSILQDISYYNEANPNVVYTTKGTYSLFYYAKLFSGLENEETLLEQWASVDKSGWWITWKDKKSNDLARTPELHYIIKLRSKELWIFTISQQSLNEILVEEKADTLLISESDILIYPFVQNSNDNKYAENYCKINSVSPKNYFELERYIRKDYLFQDVDKWQNHFILMLVLVLFIGGILVMVLTFYNEYPIRELQNYCREKVHNIPSTVRGIEIFQFTMKRMEEQVTLLKDKQRKNQLLLRLLYGKESDTVEFKEALQKAGIFRNAECFRVIVVTFVKEFEADISKLILALDRWGSEEYEFHTIEMYSNEGAVMIVGMREAADEDIKNELMHISNIFERDLGKQIYFYIGDKQTDLKKIHFSYLTAMACSQRKENKKENVYIYKPSKERKKFIYPNKEIGALYSALVDTDFDKATMLTNVLLDILRQQSNNRFISIALYYDILNTYYRAQIKLEMDTDVAFLDIDLLETKDTLDAVHMILRIKDQFQCYIESTKESEMEAHLVSKVVKYIDEDSEICELTVSMIADYFNISISNLSHQFKRYMNRTISDYITEKKFLHAKKLLLDSDDSVQMIAAKIGYGQTSNFIRKFKQFYGMTPLEYRNLKKDAE